jgi:hypothetical protein
MMQCVYKERGGDRGGMTLDDAEGVGFVRVGCMEPLCVETEAELIGISGEVLVLFQFSKSFFK